jgi:hypothetical protein
MVPGSPLQIQACALSWMQLHQQQTAKLTMTGTLVAAVDILGDAVQ